MEKRKKRPSTATSARKEKNRGSLSNFLDKELTSKIYGSHRANNDGNRYYDTFEVPLSPKSQREQSRKMIRPVSATGRVEVTEKKIREECVKSFTGHWYLEDCDRFKTSSNHFVR